MVMTQQYLAGELSVLLAEVERLVTCPSDACAVVVLRREAERLPPRALGPVAMRALQLVDELCWCSLAAGDMAAFERLAAVGGRLFQFGVCAGLLRDGSSEEVE
jgi:hypothetical protein